MRSGFRLTSERMDTLPPRWKESSIAHFCLSAVLILGGSPFAAPAPSDGYSITKKITIPGQGSWDYLAVDESARRLYVSHGTQVEVIDLDSQSVVGNIPKTMGVHGIAVAHDLGRGFTSNGQSSNVTIFDLKTLKVHWRCSDGQEARRDYFRSRHLARVRL